MAFFVHVADESNMERSRTEAESLVSADLGMVPHHNDVTGFVVKLIDVLGILRTNWLYGSTHRLVVQPRPYRLSETFRAADNELLECYELP